MIKMIGSAPKEPNMTDRRFWGEPCPECCTHVRHKINRKCAYCNARRVHQLYIDRKKVIGSIAHIEARKKYRAWYKRKTSNQAWVESRLKQRREDYAGNVSGRRDKKITEAIERKRIKLFRIPAWADRAKINAIYKEARLLGQTVDHIVPLKGALVSGLHVENNLMIIPKLKNLSKGNRFEV